MSLVQGFKTNLIYESLVHSNFLSPGQNRFYRERPVKRNENKFIDIKIAFK